MPSTISAGTTAGTAIAIAGDTTGNLAFQTNGTTTAMTIDTSQNVGIGTTSVGSFYGKTVEISNSADCALKFTNAQTGYTSSDGIYVGLLNSGNSDFYLNNRESGAMIFQTSNTERMRIDSSGRMTVSSQPAFLASNTTLSYTGTTNSSPFAFNNTTLNVGSVFNTSTYRFTAPIAGRYLLYFSFFFDVNVGTSNCDTLFYVNGSQLSGGTAATLASRPNQDRITVGNTLVLNLNANDYVDVRGRDSTGTGNAIYGPHSYFGGYLIG